MDSASPRILAVVTIARVDLQGPRHTVTRWLGTKKPPQTNGAALEKYRKTESQGEWKTAATAFRSFRRAAGWAIPRIIHWWLRAFTVQNYDFLFRRNATFPKKAISLFPGKKCFLRCVRFLSRFLADFVHQTKSVARFPFATVRELSVTLTVYFSSVVRAEYFSLSTLPNKKALRTAGSAKGFFSSWPYLNASLSTAASRMPACCRRCFITSAWAG